MTDIVKAPPFMPSKPQWDATVALLERALEELAQAQAERDAAREHAERQQLSKDGLYRELREMSSQRDTARHEWNAADDEAAELRLEVARLTAALDALRGAVENVINTVSHAKGCTVVSRSCNCWKARLRAALRQPAPAQGQE